MKFRFLKKAAAFITAFVMALSMAMILPEEASLGITANAEEVTIGSGRIGIAGNTSAFITENGDLYMWGHNEYGQLGDGTYEDSSEPVRIMRNVAQVSLSSSNSACITTNGDLYAWGYDYGKTPRNIMSKVAQVSLGSGFGACVTTNGDLYTWGDNYYGQLGDGTKTDKSSPTKIMSGVSQISAKGYNCACVKTNGDLYTWGHNRYGQLGDGNSGYDDLGNDLYSSEPVKIMSNVSQVSLGSIHSACVKTNGDLYTWGFNHGGQLGDGTTTAKTSPVLIKSGVAQVSLGNVHSACITTSGDLYTWGYNGDGQLGNGTTTDKTKPTKIKSNIAQVCLGASHSAYLTKNGELYTWGNNEYSQLGDGTTTNRLSPINIIVPNHIFDAEYSYNDIGHWHVCTGCGETLDYEEHIEDSGTITKEPTIKEEGEKTFKCTKCEYVIRTEIIPVIDHTHTLASEYSYDEAGHWFVCSGCDEKVDYEQHTEDEGTVTIEQIGTAEGEKTFRCKICGYVIRTEPIFPGLAQKLDVSKNRLGLGDNHSAYITANGDLYMWGSNNVGQLGDGTNTDSKIPVKIMSGVAQVSLCTDDSACITENGDLYFLGYRYGNSPSLIMSNVAQVSLGSYYTACITENGDLYTWGTNKYGQLGDGTTTDRPKPVKIKGSVVQVSLAYYHSACITENGDLYTWGLNGYGELGDGTRTDSTTPIKIMSNVVQVSLGASHSACITENGDLYTWGLNVYGQLGDGTTTSSTTPEKIMSNVAQIRLGALHGACVKTNGDLYTWGYNGDGQLGNGTTTNSSEPQKIMENVTDVCLGSRHSACIKINGELLTWGDNSYGQLGDGTTTSSSIPVSIPIEHVHDLETEYSFDETGHWYVCSECDEKVCFEAHTEDSGTVTIEPTEEDEGEKTFKCTKCEYIFRTETILKIHYHASESGYSSDKTGHWQVCSYCSEKFDYAEHTSDEGTVTKEPTIYEEGETTFKCTVCGYVIKTEPIEKLEHTHTPASEYSFDETGHWYSCSGCVEKLNFEAHTEDRGTVTIEPTETTEGEKEFKCTKCGCVTRTESIRPVPILNLDITKNNLCLGKYFSAYIADNGDLYMWGYNGSGQLGDGTTTTRSIPVKVMENVVQVSLGTSHSACITSSGELYTWGSNSNGRLGDGTTTTRKTPVKIMDNVVQVSLGTSHSACITSTGELYTWGYNNNGRLGDGTVTIRRTPVKIMGNVVQVSLGDSHSACITSYGELYTWGDNSNGKLGDGTTTYSKSPLKIMDNAAQVSLGYGHSACVTENGELYTWGSNSDGRLGNGTSTNSYTPVQIISDVSQVSLGYSHSACITSSGNLYTWGSNTSGKLGNGTKTKSETPIQIAYGVSQVSLGYDHSAYTDSNGDVYIWGDNAKYQLGDGTTTASLVPEHISMEHTHSLLDEYVKDSTGHWHKCENCNEKTDVEPHISDEGTITKEPTETTKGTMTFKCTVCGYVIKTASIPKLEHVHAYGEEWKYDDSTHWHECACGGKSDSAAHEKGEYTTVKEAALTEDGIISYNCTVCGAKVEETVKLTINSIEVTENNVVFKCSSSADDQITDIALSFDDITEALVDVMKNSDIQLVISFVNGFTAADTDNILTDAQLKAIDYVLEHDMAA